MERIVWNVGNTKKKSSWEQATVCLMLFRCHLAIFINFRILWELILCSNEDCCNYISPVVFSMRFLACPNFRLLFWFSSSNKGWTGYSLLVYQTHQNCLGDTNSLCEGLLLEFYTRYHPKLTSLKLKMASLNLVTYWRSKTLASRLNAVCWHQSEFIKKIKFPFFFVFHETLFGS